MREVIIGVGVKFDGKPWICKIESYGSDGGGGWVC